MSSHINELIALDPDFRGGYSRVVQAGRQPRPLPFDSGSWNESDAGMVAEGKAWLHTPRGGQPAFWVVSDDLTRPVVRPERTTGLPCTFTKVLSPKP
ncbi:MAG: hypothetical protein ACYCOU_02590 [Sulfobacillus sp.]